MEDKPKSLFWWIQSLLPLATTEQFSSEISNLIGNIAFKTQY